MNTMEQNEEKEREMKIQEKAMDRTIEYLNILYYEDGSKLSGKFLRKIKKWIPERLQVNDLMNSIEYLVYCEHDLGKHEDAVLFQAKRILILMALVEQVEGYGYSYKEAVYLVATCCYESLEAGATVLATIPDKSDLKTSLKNKGKMFVHLMDQIHESDVMAFSPSAASLTRTLDIAFLGKYKQEDKVIRGLDYEIDHDPDPEFTKEQREKVKYMVREIVLEETRLEAILVSKGLGGSYAYAVLTLATAIGIRGLEDGLTLIEEEFGAK